MPHSVSTATTSRRRIPAAQAFKRKKPQKNASRERLHAELTTLRASVAQLETQLEQLQQHHLQYENRRLRAALWRQLHEGRRVIATLTGFTPEALGCSLFSLPTLALRDARDLHDAYGLRFQRLIHELPHAFAQLATVFHHETDSPAHKPFAARIRTCADAQPLMEARDSIVIGFDVARCFRALWRAMGPRGFESTDADVRAVGPQVCTVRLRRQVQQPDAARLVYSTSSVAIGQFTNGTQTAVVWRGVTTADGIDESDTYVDETGWIWLAHDEHQDTTRMRTCVQWVPRRFVRDGHATRVPLASCSSRLAQLAFESTARSCVRINDAMESVLIDDCMRDATALT